jgi:lipopolysaccharide export system protein LptA
MIRIVIMLITSLIYFNASSSGNLSGNKEQIEITANNLAVDQNQKTATFTGQVEAIQGVVKLKADKMIAFYVEEKDQMAKGAISKILTFGNVFISNDQQTASGDEGEYKVYEEIIELKGSVVLIKGKNIVKGNRIIYNLKTGQSQLFSDNKEIENNSNKSRVKAIFIPKASEKNE